MLDSTYLRQHWRGIALGEQGQRLLSAIDQAGGVREATVLAADIGPFTGTHREFFQLTHLPLQTLALQQHLFCVTLEFLALTHDGAPAAISDSHRSGLILQASMRIQQQPLGIGFKK